MVTPTTMSVKTPVLNKRPYLQVTPKMSIMVISQITGPEDENNDRNNNNNK